MIAFDSDILTEVWKGKLGYADRAALIPREEQFVPIVVAEEAMRGWLNYVRQADAGKIRVPLTEAYEQLQTNLQRLGRMHVLPYSAHAHTIYLRLKSQKLRIGTRDLRIASIALAHDATLITRNRRDFEIVPTLKLEVWN